MEAIRSISADKVKAAGLKVGDDKRAYLCKEHYKEYKRKQERQDPRQMAPRLGGV